MKIWVNTSGNLSVREGVLLYLSGEAGVRLNAGFRSNVGSEVIIR